MWGLFGILIACCVAAICLLALQFLPMLAIRKQIGVLLAGDTTTLAPAVGNVITPIIAAFVPSENLTAGGLTLGSANGLGGVVCATGAQETGLDPVTNAQIITLKPAAGSGFRWVTSGTISSPITVYGYALTDTTLGTLLAVSQLPVPVVLNQAGLVIDADPALMTFVVQPVS